MADSIEPAKPATDNYVVVARRYRPRGFDELVGQDQVGRALKNAIDTNRVGHAYLFTGARGVGKTSTARIFAKALNNPDGPNASPDNLSDTAQAIDMGEDVDVIEIDGASNRGIDEIRSLRANVGVRPSRSRFKIYIIDEVHMLTGAAFNALLKTLEEPPEHVKFIFCTTDPEKIPITVLSRCQRFDFAPVEVSKIAERLRDIVTAESAEADDAALELIARRAAGSMRDSQSLLEQVMSFCSGRLTAEQVHSMLGTADEERLHSLALAMAARDPAETLRQMDAAIDAGVDAGRLAEQLLGYFRDLMAVAVGCDDTMLRHTSSTIYGELKQLADKWGLQTVLAVVSLLDQTLVRIRHSVYSRVLLEATLIQACVLPDLQRLVDLTAAAGTMNSGAAIKAVEKKNAPVTAAPHFNTTSPARSLVPVGSGAIGSAQANVSSASTGLATSVQARPQAVATLRVDSAAQPNQANPNPANPNPANANPAIANPASDLPVAIPNVSWTSSGVADLWKSCIGHLESMTESLARAVQRVECVGPGQVRLVFPAKSKLAMSRCDSPGHRDAIVKTLTALAGQNVSLEFFAEAGPSEPVLVPKASGVTRMHRMRELENHVLVKSCIELFEAEIVKIDHPRVPPPA